MEMLLKVNGTYWGDLYMEFHNCPQKEQKGKYLSLALTSHYTRVVPLRCSLPQAVRKACISSKCVHANFLETEL